MPMTEKVENTAVDADRQRLRDLVPLRTLPDEAFDELLDDILVERRHGGTLLFRQGDADHVSYYLLQGKVELLTGDHEVDSIEANSDKARFPIANMLPRQHSARAAGPVRIAQIDSRKISDVLARCHTVDYQVDTLDEADDGDWMSMMLRLPVLQQLPAANLQRVMMSVEQVEVAAGEQIIRQGDPGDYYFMLVHGQASVQRDPGDGSAPTELARLGPGDAFGEEALLSDRPRNSTISMLEGGMVMRLSKADFIDLIQMPLSMSLRFPEARQKVEQGALWLDLRPQQQFDAEHLPGAINLPLDSLRYQVGSLAPDRHYVLYSDTGRRASVAAFLLAERGFDISVLSGAWQDSADAPPDNTAQAPEEQDTSAHTEQLQQRIAAAEKRAQELEQRLAQAHANVQDAELERQQHIDSAQQAVDLARKEAEQNERAKDAALQAQREAYDEMETLTSNLEHLQTERTELADRMREIEGLDKKLQQRLEKVERELIGERERAESASATLEDMVRRMNNAVQDRENERDHHARERGELKEEITALQLELESTAEELAAIKGDDSLEKQFAEQREGLQAQLEESERQRQAFEGLVEDLRTEAAEHAERLGRRDMDLSGLREQLEQSQQQRTQAEESAQQLQAERQQLHDQVAQLSQRLDQAQQQVTTGETENAGWQRRLEDAERQATQTEDSLQSQLQQTEDARDQLQARLDRSDAELRQQREDMQRQQAEREQLQNDLQQLHDQQRLSGESEQQALAQGQRLSEEIEQLNQRLQEAQVRVDSMESDNAGLRQQLQERDSQASQMEQQLREQLQQLEQSREQLQARLDQVNGDLQQEQQTVEQQLAERERAQQALLAELEQLRNEHQQAQASSQQLQLERQGALDDAQQLRERLQQAEAEVELREHAETKLQHHLDEIQRRLEENGDRSSQTERQLQDQLQQAEQAQQQLRQQLDRLTAESSERQQAAEQQLAEHDLAQQALQSELDELRQQRQLDDESSQQAEAQREHLAEEVAQLSERLQQAQAKIETDESERAILQKRLEATGERSSLTEQQLREQLAQAEQTRERLQGQLDGQGVEQAERQQAAEQQLAEREQALQQLQTELDQLRQQQQQSQASTQQLQVDRQQALDNANQLEERLQQTRARVEEREQANTELQHQLDALQRQLTESGDRSTQTEQQLHEKLQQVEQAREQLQLQLAKLGADLSERDRAQQGLQAELAALRQQQLDAGESAQHAGAERERLEAEVSRLSADLQSAQTQVEAVGSERASLQQELERLGAALQESEQRAAIDEALRKDFESASKVRHELAAGLEMANLENEELQQQLEALRAQLQAQGGQPAGNAELQTQLEAVQANEDSLRAELRQAVEQRDTSRRQAEQLQTQLAERQSEVEQLRGVMETYVEHIQGAQTGDEDLRSLRTELQMVREQAVKDVAQIREQLSAAEARLKQQRVTEGRETLDGEAMRQQLDELQRALAERQRELVREEEARQMLEDKLEDANAELDTLRRQVDKMAVELKQANSRSAGSEQVHEQASAALREHQLPAGQREVADLSDLRLGRKPLDIDKVAGSRGLNGRALGAAIGAVLAIAALEAFSFLYGHGELISSLFGR